MKVRLKDDFKCAPEGHTVIVLKKDQEVEGALAQFVLDHDMGVKTRESKKTPKPEYTKKPKPENYG